MDPHNQQQAGHPQGARPQNAVYDTTHGGHYGTSPMHLQSNAVKWPRLTLPCATSLTAFVSTQVPVRQ